MPKETSAAAAMKQKPIALAAEHIITAALEQIDADACCLWVAESDMLAPAGQWRSCTPTSLLNTPWQQRHALAVAYLPAALEPDQAKHILSSLRDLHARHVLAFIPLTEYRWQEADLLALGMQRQACFEHQQQIIEAWSFDIRTYKAVPDWLNPKFWANPEQWGKFRW